ADYQKRMSISIFDWPNISALLGGLAPAVGFAVAVQLDLRGRNSREKPPQVEKLLRPPGYSLLLRLDELADKMLNELVSAGALSACAGVGTAMTARFVGFGAPLLWNIGSSFFALATAISATLFVVRAFR